jgi:hypothetical protein
MSLKIPKPDKDGWFTTQFGEPNVGLASHQTCNPPIGRAVEAGAASGGAIESVGDVSFNGSDWIKDGAAIAIPEFWRVKR